MFCCCCCCLPLHMFWPQWVTIWGVSGGSSAVGVVLIRFCLGAASQFFFQNSILVGILFCFVSVVWVNFCVFAAIVCVVFKKKLGVSYGSSIGYGGNNKHICGSAIFFRIGFVLLPWWFGPSQAKTCSRLLAFTIPAENSKAVFTGSSPSSVRSVLSFSFFVILCTNAAVCSMFKARVSGSAWLWTACSCTGASTQRQCWGGRSLNKMHGGQHWKGLGNLD
jgi:hypothetical protein